MAGGLGVEAKASPFLFVLGWLCPSMSKYVQDSGLFLLMSRLCLFC